MVTNYPRDDGDEPSDRQRLSATERGIVTSKFPGVILPDRASPTQMEVTKSNIIIEKKSTSTELRDPR